MKLLALILFSITAASAHQPAKPRISTTPLTTEQIAIYGNFLKAWNDGAKTPLSVADTTDSFPRSDDPFILNERSGCLRGFGPLKDSDIVHQLPPELILTSNVRLVDAATYKKRDPGTAIRNGEPVDSAVDTGIANGLFSFTEIRFNPTHTLAAFSYSFVCGGLCGSGDS